MYSSLLHNDVSFTNQCFASMVENKNGPSFLDDGIVYRNCAVDMAGGPKRKVNNSKDRTIADNSNLGIGIIDRR